MMEKKIGNRMKLLSSKTFGVMPGGPCVTSLAAPAPASEPAVLQKFEKRRQRRRRLKAAAKKTILVNRLRVPTDAKHNSGSRVQDRLWSSVQKQLIASSQKASRADAIAQLLRARLTKLRAAARLRKWAATAVAARAAAEAARVSAELCTLREELAKIQCSTSDRTTAAALGELLAASGGVVVAGPDASEESRATRLRTRHSASAVREKQRSLAARAIASTAATLAATSALACSLDAALAVSHARLRLAAEGSEALDEVTSVVSAATTTILSAQATPSGGADVGEAVKTRSVDAPPQPPPSSPPQPPPGPPTGPPPPVVEASGRIGVPTKDLAAVRAENERLQVCTLGYTSLVVASSVPLRYFFTSTVRRTLLLTYFLVPLPVFFLSSLSFCCCRTRLQSCARNLKISALRRHLAHGSWRNVAARKWRYGHISRSASRTNVRLK